MRHRADPSPGLRQPPQSSHCCRNWRDCGTAGDGNGQGAEGLRWGQHSHLPACRHCRELGGASLLSAPSSSQASSICFQSGCCAVGSGG